MTPNEIAEWTRHPRTLALARRNCSNQKLAEDCIQETAVAALEKLPPDHPTPLAWLSLTLNRKCWEASKEDKREVLRRDNDVEVKWEPIAEDTDTLGDREYAKYLLSALKPAERLAISQFAWGYSYKEIVKLNGWSYTKVDKMIKRAKKRMRDYDHAATV